MTRKDYEAMVLERCQDYVDAAYAVIALNGEAGEVAEWFKKAVLRGNPEGKLSLNDLKKELGDVLFYLTRLGQLHGWNLNEIMETNYQKLRMRDEKKVRKADGQLPLEML